MNLIKKFFLKKNEEKKILILAIFYILYTQILIKIVPFKIIIKLLKLKQIKLVNTNQSIENNIKEIKWAIKVCTKFVFWESLCLNQALTAYKLLKIYNNQAYLYLGVSKENNKMIAHAWVISNNQYITGKDNKQYNVISIFE